MKQIPDENVADKLIEFVIYARRSREEDEQQKTSIPQQIEACYLYCEKESVRLAARPMNYPIEDKIIKEIQDDNQANTSRAKELIAFYSQYWIITERGSAKEPFKREQWNKLIEKVKDRKIQGLLGYSPDRFSRNLQEGGVN
jgi:DNA invertase Pin-like site-specific DNA recombinase